MKGLLDPLEPLRAYYGARPDPLTYMERKLSDMMLDEVEADKKYALMRLRAERACDDAWEGLTG
jgi:hypothetical protein